MKFLATPLIIVRLRLMGYRTPYVVVVEGPIINQRVDQLYQLLRRRFVAMVTERDVGDIRRFFPAHRVYSDRLEAGISLYGAPQKSYTEPLVAACWSTIFHICYTLYRRAK